MIVFEILEILNDGLNKKYKKSFIVVANKFMTNEFICKEALSTLFGYGHIALKALVLHAKNHVLPIHGLIGKVDPKTA